MKVITVNLNGKRIIGPEEQVLAVTAKKAENKAPKTEAEEVTAAKPKAAKTAKKPTAKK